MNSFAAEAKPHPVLPFWVEAPGPEQIPEGPAQQPLTQFPSLRHCPPMNWVSARPTFFSPAGSKDGPPLAGTVPKVGALSAGVVVVVVGSVAGAGAASEPNPHPVLPFWVEAPGPEQIPVGLAQHPLTQFPSLRHCPPMNWAFAMPMFLAPAGSKGGTAKTMAAKERIVAMVNDFMFAVEKEFLDELKIAK